MILLHLLGKRNKRSLKMAKPHVSFNQDNMITVVSDKPFKVIGENTTILNGGHTPSELVGKILPGREKTLLKPHTEIRIAIICNWNTKCGISTYSSFLVNALRQKVGEIRIFSEEAITKTAEDDVSVVRCWKRGECMLPMVEKVLAWKPDFVLVQHEFGIFPNAFYFMQMMQKLENTPYAVVMHSVYEHLDKIVYSSCVKNIIVHNEKGKEVLVKYGQNAKDIHTILHGCVNFDRPNELWNINHNPYTIVQFGFGFAYKGVDRALDAIHFLKGTDPKFNKIFYTFLISDNDYNSRLHLEYYNSLMKKVEDLGLVENVAMIRKFQSEQMLNYYLRLNKLAIFPYLNNPNNMVYAASGAIRVAMANRIPVIASDAHLFDDLEGIVPRPSDFVELAREIDHIFSDSDYKNGIIAKSDEFITRNTWDKAAESYLSVYQSIIST